ncbi:MAG: sterol desaturase family protein, partial [Actinomycetes bacterium]
PFYFGSMAAEAVALRRRADAEGGPRPSDYERNDTIASLTMGTANLLVPLLVRNRMQRLDPQRGSTGKKVLVGAAALAAAAAVGDAVARAMRSELEAGEVASTETPDAPDEARATAAAPRRATRRERLRAVRQGAGVAALGAVAAAGAVACGTWASRTSAKRLYERRIITDLHPAAAFAAAMVGWDFIYYWNHRFMHESRFLWAIHVVHHSSERYNLSTALRQPVADALGVFVPYGVLSYLGVPPKVIEDARAINLIYQFWIHTDLIPKLGAFEKVFNTPSHHRAHHGANRQYLDRNHGGILIIWDRMFGTFEEEDEPVVYGLTKNINSFNPLVIASHEHADIAEDIVRAGKWRDRISYVVRGPGWAYEHRRADGVDAPKDTDTLAPVA